MPPKRPEFSLPSTKPSTGPSAKTEWVYRSDDSDAATIAPVVSEPVAIASTDTRVEEILGRYASYAGGAAIIPIPWLDVLAIGGVQMKMLAELCEHHGVSFDDEIGRALIAAIAGSYGATRLAVQAGRSLLKAVPIVGTIGTALTMSVMAYGATWAIGKVFSMHLASGGTLYDLDMPAMRARYQDQLSAAPVR